MIPKTVIRLQKEIKSTFLKIKSFFSSLFPPDFSSSDCILLLFEVRPGVEDEPALQYWCDQVEPIINPIYIVRIEQLKIQIPDEYIGILSVFRGAQLLCQEYLKIQSKVVEKRSLAFQRIDSSNLPVSSNYYSKFFHP